MREADTNNDGCAHATGSNELPAHIQSCAQIQSYAPPPSQHPIMRSPPVDFCRMSDLTRREVFHVITRMKSQIDEASGSGIPIDALSPAQWGERKVAAWEEDVFKRIKEADEDKSGVISVKEVSLERAACYAHPQVARRSAL